MDAVHPGDLAKRQGLGGFLSSIFGGGNGQSTSTSSKSDPLGLGGLTSGLLPSNPLSLSLPGLTRSSATSTSAASSSSTSTTTSSSATSTSSSVTSTSSSSSTTSSSISTTTPPPSSTSSASDVSSTSIFTSSSDGNAVVYTTVIAVPASSSSSSSTVGAVAPKSFFQNKPLEGGVFAIVGVVGLVILVAIATFAIRRKAKNRLHEEALTWPDAGPTAADDVERAGGYGSSFEKGRRLSDSSTAHGTSNSGHGVPPMPPGIGGYRPGGYGGYPQQQQMAYNAAGQGYGRSLTGPANAYPQAQYQQNTYGAPRLPNPVYEPVQRSPVYPTNPGVPQYGVTSPPPPPLSPGVQKTLPRLETEHTNLIYANHTSPISAKRQSGSLLSPASMGELENPYDGVASDAPAQVRKRASSHSRELDPSMPGMPAPPTLPDTFGNHDDGLYGVGSVDEYADKRVLKVANQ